MLKEEDIILHGSTIADSDGLLHAKFKSKHKSKSGKWVYVYDDTKKAVGGLFDKDVKENITKSEVVNDGSSLAISDASYKAYRKVTKAGRKSDKNYDRSNSTMTSLRSGGSGRTQAVSGEYTVRKKGSIHKGYDATIRALKGLTK